MPEIVDLEADDLLGGRLSPPRSTGAGNAAHRGPVAVDMDRDTLDEAYERLHKMGPEFGGDEEGNNGLSNHGPMAVEVMVRRGLDLDVEHWVDDYLPRLEELPTPSDPISDENWRAALGDGRRVADWTAYFSRQTAEQPWRDVLIAWWPRLLPGIAAGATHGVIRVSHAVRALLAGDESPSALAELAHGLAFWAGRSRTVPGVTAPTGRLDPAAALASIPRLDPQRGVIASRLPRLAELPDWPAAVSALRPPGDPHDVPALLAELVDAATIRYLTHGHGSPVLLVHTATAPNAVLHTLPALPSALWSSSLTAAWAASAAVIAAYAPPSPGPYDQAPGSPLGGDTAAAALDRAAGHGDEHVLKFTDTAVEVFERTGDPDALAAAARVAQLISPRLS